MSVSITGLAVKPADTASTIFCAAAVSNQKITAVVWNRNLSEWTALRILRSTDCRLDRVVMQALVLLPKNHTRQGQVPPVPNFPSGATPEENSSLGNGTP